MGGGAAACQPLPPWVSVWLEESCSNRSVRATDASHYLKIIWTFALAGRRRSTYKSLNRQLIFTAGDVRLQQSMQMHGAPLLGAPRKQKVSMFSFITSASSAFKSRIRVVRAPMFTSVLDPGWGKRFCLLQTLPHWLWNSPGLLFKGLSEFFPGVKAAGA